MKVIHLARGAGKTDALIREAARLDGELYDTVIVVAQGLDVRRLQNRASALGLSIRPPVTFDSLQGGALLGTRVTHLLFDDMDIILSHLTYRACSGATAHMASFTEEQ